MSKKSASGVQNAGALKVNCNAAVLILIYAVLAAAFAYHHQSGFLVLSSAKTGEVYARYPVHTSDTFSIGFIHSVNKSPVTDYYEIRPDGIRQYAGGYDYYMERLTAEQNAADAAGKNNPAEQSPNNSAA